MREWLKKLREQSGLSQAEVAEKSELSQNYYSSIETGIRGDKLPVQTAKKIASALDFDWSRFYEEKNIPVNHPIDDAS